jgi:hypothetical protein
VLLSVVALVVLVAWVAMWVGLLGTAVGAAPTVLVAGAVQRWVRRVRSRRWTETMGRHRAAGPPLRWPVVVVAAADAARQWLGLAAVGRSRSTAAESGRGRDAAAAD